MMMFYIAEVRDNRDPSGTGRIKVRFYNKENDEQNIPDDGLRWAHPIFPITALPNAGIGTTPAAPMINTRVVCIFLPDDDGKQSPYYIGGIARAEKVNEKGIQQNDPRTGTKTIMAENAAPDTSKVIKGQA
jgi:hypothetical protein